jgi:hypothetical protein
MDVMRQVVAPAEGSWLVGHRALSDHMALALPSWSAPRHT